MSSKIDVADVFDFTEYRMRKVILKLSLSWCRGDSPLDRASYT